ncbi:Hsp20/alpha crystallin family protein [Oliverpabstia sp.]|uniref:Hsp20/alpha crystallin family protein n=1 Tax=Oliverpabstia sp. TaxID=2815798 RepID=UPI00258CCB65|nr:Hsp20/alpha crystallin family protein [Oliverpabstia sp.]MCI5494515.1 Hsp20/alpha crystallin family protein [Lachnospiraceae bacterium]MCI7526195.1 Hsp20/alpha crystallin family protein [Oliverpabstia sp.]
MLVPSIFSNNFVDDLFDDVFPFGGMNYRFPKADSAVMNTDVKEYDDRYQLDLELPGMKKEDIQAELKDGYLIINAKHEDKQDEKDDKGKFIRKERYYGSYQRSFYVGDAVQQEDIKASFENGVLTLEVPKKAEEPEKVEEKHYISIEG